MNRKLVLALLCLVCLLLAGNALAEKQLTARSGDLAACIDGNGGIVIPGRSGIVNDETADQIVSIDNYRITYLSAGIDSAAGDLHLIDLESLDEAGAEDILAVRQVYAACQLDSDSIYYVPDDARTQLCRLNPATRQTETVYTTSEAIDRLYASAEGMVFQLAEQAGTLVYVPSADGVDFCPGGIPQKGTLTDSYEISISSENLLYVRDLQSLTSRLVDANVNSFAPLDGYVYYIADTGAAQSLRRYDPASRRVDTLSSALPEGSCQLTASGASLFALDGSRNVHSISLKTGAATQIASFTNLGVLSLPEGKSAVGVRIEGAPGAVNVYVELEDADALPNFTFIEFESDLKKSEAEYAFVKALPVQGESSVWDLLKPVPQYETLERGSRGDAVRAIQDPLYRLGYYDYKVDGIFGPRTQWAIRLVQADLGLPDNGVADADLQRTILSGKLTAYDRYVPLDRGNRGLRVQLMQQRLRDLGYLADAADRIFGPRTQKAVQLFQSENGLKVNEGATRKTLELLFSDRAKRCSSYIDLRRGDSGYRVRELNNRLRDLYYLESALGSSYTAETTSAIRVFQRTAGLPETGVATADVQRALFADNAPEAPGFILLRRGDSNSRVRALQERLLELDYFDARITGYFGSTTRDAVMLFQQRVGLKPSGIATVRTQQLLFAEGAPHYVAPTFLSDPVITLDAYEYVDGGVYRIAEDSVPGGTVTFDWYADGGVRSYRVRIEDSKGRVLLDDETLMTRTGVSIATLRQNVTYTLTVTAYPLDGDAAHITSASLRFSRIKPELQPPQIGRIGDPQLTVSTVARVENGVQYVLPGTVSLRWSAPGDVAAYRAVVLDEADHPLIEIGESMAQNTDIDTSRLTQGEIYTLYVYAIPVNGSMQNARMSSLRFSLPVVELPEPEPEGQSNAVIHVPVGAPRLDILPLAVNMDGIAYLSGDYVTINWIADGDVQNYIVTIHDGSGRELLHVETRDTSGSFSADKLSVGSVYTVSVTAVSNAAESDSATTTEQFALYGPVEETYKTSPTYSEESEEDTPEETEPQPQDGGSSEDAQQPQDGGSSEDAQQPQDGGSSEDAQQPQDGGSSEDAQQPRDGGSSEDAQQPRDGGSSEDARQPQDGGSSEDAQQPQDGGPQEEADQPQEDDSQEDEEQPGQDTQGEDLPEADDGTAAPEAGDWTSAAIGLPEISITPMESRDGDITYVDGEIITLAWQAEGEVASYRVEILNSSGVTMTSAETDKTSLSFYRSVLQDGEVYTLNVEAVPADMSLASTSASARFAAAQVAAQMPAEDEQDAQQGGDSEEPAPQSAPVVNEPETQEPEYQEPEYQEPEYQEPEYQEPEYQEPETQEPEYQEPEYQEPEYQEPETQEPEYQEPETQEPEYQEPEYQEPEYQEPEYQEPETQEPEYQEPEYQEPQVEYTPVSAPVIEILPAVEVVDDVTYIEPGSYTLTWYSEGDVGSYDVSILDASGATLVSQRMESTGATLPTDNMQPGAIYTLCVTANPVDGSGMEPASASIRYALYVYDAESTDDSEGAEETYEAYEED